MISLTVFNDKTNSCTHWKRFKFSNILIKNLNYNPISLNNVDIVVITSLSLAQDEPEENTCTYTTYLKKYFYFSDVVDGTRQGVLSVQGIDFCIEANGENHHTSKFNLMTRSVDRCLVIRRGQSFKLDILLNRPYDANRDAISFIFYAAGMKAMQLL